MDLGSVAVQSNVDTFVFTLSPQEEHKALKPTFVEAKLFNYNITACTGTKNTSNMLLTYITHYDPPKLSKPLIHE